MPHTASFFSAFRTKIYGGTLSQSAVDACNAIYNECIAEGVTSLPMYAYMLATARREAGPRMVPCSESGKGAGKRYGRPGAAMKSTTVVPPECQFVMYYGRGLVQVTWYENYAKLRDHFKYPYTVTPDLLLQISHSSKALVYGMVSGLFTGHALHEYFNDTTLFCDWVNARRTVNGVDHADEIAADAKAIYACLLLGSVKMTNDVPVAGVQPDVPKPAPAPAPRRGLLADIMSWFGRKPT